MIIKKVVKSLTEPSTSCIWVKGNSLYLHINGKWTKFGLALEDLLNDLLIDNNLHNEFFLAYYKSHPEEIVNLPEETIKKYCELHPEHIVKLPTETIYKLFPDIIAIIEPLDGAIMFPVYRYEVNRSSPEGEDIPVYIEIQAKNGIITKDLIKDPVYNPNWDQNSPKRASHINPYNWSAIKYCNTTIYGKNLTIIPYALKDSAITTSPLLKVKVIEGLTGWKNFYGCAFDNWIGKSEGKDIIYIDKKLTINGDWWLLKENLKAPDPEEGSSNVVSLRGIFEATVENSFELEFNGTIYLEYVDITGISYLFRNIKCYQYPTIDISRYKSSYMGNWVEGLGLYTISVNDSKFTWIPEKPQKFLIKGIGNSSGFFGNTVDLWGIINWDYDDMVASLITYAYNNAEKPSPGGKVNFVISQTSFNKLTDDDKAAIVAMGNSVSAHA